MAAPDALPESLLLLLPEDRLGAVERVEPMTLGLSGAAVYAVSTARGRYVLRLQGQRGDDAAFAQQALIVRRAAEAGVAPALVHVDEAARATVSVRVPGGPMAAALADPAQRGPLFASVVDRLRVVHALDPAGLAPGDPVAFARAAWEAGRLRAGFPPWATSLESTFAAFEAALARDPRLVVSHNDLNPTNVLWDGARAWLVDWEVAGLGHPHYDLATLALFLRLPEEAAFGLSALHDGAPLDGRAQAMFRALRRLVGVLGGLTFLSLADDLRVRPAPTRESAPTLGACYDAMRAGELDLQTDHGRMSMGLALLAEGLAAPSS